ncbi:MAG TPA: allantoicase [Gemmatimonadaceae bacterium]|nr:allantoicase [Gemmatimonadaceae bacterium]
MPTDFTDLIDLASQRLGGAVIAANDEFFAEKENLLKPGRPEWREGVYTERGKWMDGWETRRRRTPGHDWAIVRLGAPGIVRGLVIDTAFFTGNYPEKASVDACALGDNASVEGILSGAVHWDSLLPQTALAGNAVNEFPIDGQRRRVTHLRLNIFPDGGVARLRVHGEVVPDADVFTREADLAAMENGAFVVACSDMHYGDRQNLILPGRAMDMGDGWQTRRRRGPGHDWSIIRLARRGTISRIELDTDHFKGNAPGSCMLEYADVPEGNFHAETASWEELLPETPLEPHTRHKWYEFDSHAATHVRLNIYPDGGVARIRLFGNAS